MSGTHDHHAHDVHGHHHREPESVLSLRVRALESLLVEKKLVSSEAVDRIVAAYEEDIGPHNGAKVVARAWALARYTPHPVAALEAPVELGGFWTQTWPTTVIRCRRAANPPETHQRRTAERLKGAWHELDTGHYPMLSQPEELTRLLLGPVS